MTDKIGHFNFTRLPVDHHFLVLIPWLATLLTGFSVIVGLFLNDAIFVFTSSIATLVFIIAYFLVKAGKSIRVTAWLMAINTLVLTNIVWFRFEGSKGTAPMMVLMLLLSISLFFKKTERLLAISFLLINLFLLFYIEYNYPLLIKPYKNQIARLADLFIAFSVSGVFIAFVVQGLLNSYVIEKSKAEQVDKLKTSFLANISHEIRTPMNAILGFSNLITQTRTKTKERRIYTKFIFDACKSLTNLIDEIIDIARIESNHVNIHRVRCNVTDILEMVHNSYIDSPDWQISNSVHFTAGPATFENDVFIETDAILLKQVLTKLIDNAIKFTQNGFIEYGYENQNSQLLFYVKDSGIGIPKEECECIFDNFSKVQQRNEKMYQGVGLGLALSKKIVELLEGNIWVSSEVGKGSTFWFTIPSNKIEIVSRKKHQ